MKCSTKDCVHDVWNQALKLCRPCNQRRLRSLPLDVSDDILKDRFRVHLSSHLNANGCWDWQGRINTEGYGKITIKNRQISAHRLSMRITTGYFSPYMILHKCNNRRCVNPNHLYEGTAAQNAKDRDKDKTQVRGEKAHNAKLNTNQVIEIKNFLRDGVSPKRLAILCQVSTRTISQIRQGISWRHI